RPLLEPVYYPRSGVGAGDGGGGTGQVAVASITVPSAQVCVAAGGGGGGGGGASSTTRAGPGPHLPRIVMPKVRGSPRKAPNNCVARFGVGEQKPACAPRS